MALGKAGGTGLGSELLFSKHKHQAFGQTFINEGIQKYKLSESFCL